MPSTQPLQERSGLRINSERQKNRKACSGTPGLRASAQPQRSIVLPQNVGGNPQSQSGTALALGGEKRLEDPLANLRRDTGTVVGHHHADSRHAAPPVLRWIRA